MNLWDLIDGSSGIIRGYSQKLNPEYQVRLRDLGFDQDTPVVCLRSCPFGGPKIFQIGDSVFSLAQDVACLIDLNVQEA